ncbi:hypothetical protein CHS0354_027722 [Potamilus streckersoni]|uniref:Uncharacterized protein n=1 Tax=Potamilus streckersoni TaxID=2493646 RepID=A0AAE0RKS3_9BIVA|nr:hypothetical protein CHS0354_027722 [Potamilus streckersoni]
MNWSVDEINQKAAKTKNQHDSPNNSTNRGRKKVMLIRRDFLTGRLKILRRSCGNPARINLDVPVEVTSKLYQRYACLNSKQGQQEFSQKRCSFILHDVVNVADNGLVEQCTKGSDVNADGIPGNVQKPFELTVGKGGEAELALKHISKSEKRSEERFTNSTSQTLNGESHVNVSQNQVIRRAFRLQFQNIRLSPSNSNAEFCKRTSNNNCFPGGFHSGDSDYKRSARDTE